MLTAFLALLASPLVWLALLFLTYLMLLDSFGPITDRIVAFLERHPRLVALLTRRRASTLDR